MSDLCNSEKNLFQTDPKFRAFLEAAPDAIVVVNNEGTIVSVNRLAEIMFGHNPGELLGKKIEILVPERFRKIHIGHRDGYFHDPKTRPMGAGRALSGLKKDGSEFPVEISLSPFETENGTLVISIARDLTERLKEESKFRGFLESAPDAVVVINRQGKIVIVNSLTEKIFGYKREELLGQLVEILVPDRFLPQHVHHREGYFADPKTRPMGEGKPLFGKRKDGSEFPVEISLSPLESNGEILVTSIIRDISARVQLEAKFKGLLESAPDGIVVVDSEGRIIIVNSQTEKLFDYNREELLGHAIEILVPERFRKDHVPTRNNYIRNPNTRPMGAGRALTGRRKDGSEFPVEISLSPLKLEGQTLVTSIIRDITDRRQIEEQMKASLREKEALLKEIHHRVKNNLQVTSSLLRLQSSYIEDPSSKELFAESQNRIRSMALVHEKLYQSKELSRINFPEYIESLSGLLFRSFGVDPEQIQLQVLGKDIFLSVETAVPCGLMINELVSNCLKHAFPNNQKGAITVTITKEMNADVFYLEVADNGVGLPPNLDIEKTESLGLQLVRTLTKQLNGQLEIKNNRPGTIFGIRFSELKGNEP